MSRIQGSGRDGSFMNEIVAGPLRSQYPSKTCKVCGLGIRYGQLICKLATSGKTTQHGQGPGVWVHEECAESAESSQQMLFE